MSERSGTWARFSLTLADASPEQLKLSLRALAQRSGEWWPEDKRLDVNPVAWLDEVILRERQYFDRRGGIRPSESFARAEIYQSAIRDAAADSLTTLQGAIDRELERICGFHERFKRLLKARKALPAAKRRAWKVRYEIRWLTKSMQRLEFCAALLTTFRTLADQHIASSVTESTASVDAAALPTPRDHNSQVSAVSIRPAPEATDGRQSRKQA